MNAFGDASQKARREGKALRGAWFAERIGVRPRAKASDVPSAQANENASSRILIALALVTLFWAVAFLQWPLRDLVVPWDSKNQFYTFFRFMADAIAQGSTPFWNPYHYAGHPSIADPQSMIFSPAFVLWALVDPKPSLFAFDLMVFAHLLVGGLALAGVPPLNGFISKLALAQSGVEANDWVTLGLIVGASILTLIYMSRTWQHIFQRAPEEGVKAKPTGDSQLAPALLIAGCVFLGFYAQPLLDLATRAVTQIGNPQVYIQAVFGG